MSYDIELASKECPHCHRRDEPSFEADPTCNLHRIFCLALISDDGIKVINGMTGKESQNLLEVAHARLRDESLISQFRALEPENKWGTLEDAQSIIGRMMNAARDYPDDMWSVR